MKNTPNWAVDLWSQCT